VCGASIEGVDSYVVCGDCLNDFENGFRTNMVRFRLYDELAHDPLTPEDESRLRKLLDW
jgi:hypothetical protein